MNIQNNLNTAPKTEWPARTSRTRVFTGGNTELHLFASDGRAEALRDALGSNPLHANQKNNLGQTPLLIAVKKSNIECVKVLLDHRADITHKDLLSTAVKTRNLPIVELLIESNVDIVPTDCMDPLFFAISSLRDHKGRKIDDGGDLELVKALVDAGANPHAKSTDGLEESLLFRLSEKQSDIAGFLLEHPHCLDPNWHCKDIYSPTPLFHAFLIHSVEIAEKLLKMGADIKVRKEVDGCTVLHLALRMEYLSLAILALEWGANPNAKNKKDETGLTQLLEILELFKTVYRIAGAISERKIMKLHKIIILLLEKKAAIELEDTYDIQSFLSVYPNEIVSRRIHDYYLSIRDLR